MSCHHHERSNLVILPCEFKRKTYQVKFHVVDIPAHAVETSKSQDHHNADPFSPPKFNPTQQHELLKGYDELFTGQRRVNTKAIGYLKYPIALVFALFLWYQFTTISTVIDIFESFDQAHNKQSISVLLVDCHLAFSSKESKEFFLAFTCSIEYR